MLPMFPRQILEWIGKVAGRKLVQFAEPASVRALGGAADFDTTTMPVRLALPSRPRTMPDPIVTVHVTDVAGGFGVSSRKVKAWRALLEQGKVPAELAAQLDLADLGGASFLLALLERYSGCAYHRIGSRRAGHVRNHPATLRTSHGNGGNRGMGWALDAGHREDLTGELAAIGFSSLVGCVLECHEASGEVVSIVPHRVFSKARRVDTAAIAWRSIVLPAAAALGPSVCRIDYELREGGGLPIPRSWDPSALFDDKGKRL